MIKARGGLLSHVHSARGALLQHRSSPRSLLHAPSLFKVDSSPRNFLTNRGFRGFLSIRDIQNDDPAGVRFLGCSTIGSSHRTIVALWSFESRIAHFDHVTRLTTPKGLHTSTKGKLTTSELIKSLQLAKSGGIKTATASNALATSDRSVEGGEVQGSTSRLSESNPVFENLDKDRQRDTGAVKKPLSKLIPQHVVDMGFAKKECFSKKQDQERGDCEAIQTKRQRGPNRKQSIPVLNLANLRNDAADESASSNTLVGTIHGDQHKLLDPQSASQVLYVSGAGKEGAVRHQGLLTAALDAVPFIKKVDDPDLFGQSVPAGKQVGESADVSSRQRFASGEESRKQAQDFYKSSVARESSRLCGKEDSRKTKRTEVQFHPPGISESITGSQHFVQGRFTSRHTHRRLEESESAQLAAENPAKQELTCAASKDSMRKHHLDVREEGNLQAQSSSRQSTWLTKHSRELSGRPAAVNKANTNWQHTGSCSEITDQQSSLYPRSSSEENNDIIGDQPCSIKLPTSTEFQSLSEGGADFLSKEDPQLGMHRVKGAFDRWVAEVPLPEGSMPATAKKPYDRTRPKKKKNELKEKDLSVKPIAGEPHYEYLIRRKQLRAEAQKALKDDVDDYEHVGDDWIRKRLGWLCKEIPVLKASGLVKMLNNQRKWIKQEHLKELIEHLIRYMELNRAHRVLKWMQQQPFYEFEYELHNNMAFILGRNNKLSRCQDVYDEIVRNGQFPDASVFTALIKAYLQKGDQGDINDAWKLYSQMLQLGLQVSESLSEILLKSLVCPTGRWIRQAEELLVKMKASGVYINEEMYSRVLDLYGKRGDHKKIDAMINEMKANRLKMTLGVLNAKLEACVKDGDTVRAEHTLEEIVELGLKPDWRSYSNLIQVYGKANMPRQSWQVFEKMKGIGIPINFATYHAIIEAMAADGQHVEEVMQVLTAVEESGIRPMQPCYNSVMNMFLRLKNHDAVELIYNRGKAAKVRPAHAAYNMLMKAYTEGGQLDKAEALFREMKATEGMGPNTHTYNILLEGYGVGCFKERVRELFEEMSAKGCQLDPDVKDRIKSMISVKRIAELEKKKLILTDEQREIIPGLLLGGAKMESPDRNRTYELHMEFDCEKEVKRVIKDRLSFLFQAWLKPSQLLPSSQSTASSECQEALEGASASKPFVRLETVNHGSFRFYAHQYRPNGEPVIPKLIHRWLKPRTLAYWYMYGGRKCQRTGGIILYASKYSGKQIQIVVKALKARTMDCRRKKKRNGDVIRFEGRSAMWLWKLMEPYILKAVKEQLKPEEIPVDLALAAGSKSWESQDQASSDEDEVTSDEDDWDELEADRSEPVMEVLED